MKQERTSVLAANDSDDVVCNADERGFFGFVIPVRHQDNSKDWAGLKRKLLQAARSIANQTRGGWRGVVVANRGADLPPLPSGFSVEWVDFPPNPHHERTAKVPKEDFEYAVKIDKGRRVLRGLLRLRHCRFAMVVDDDDFVNRHIVEYAYKNNQANGWVVSDGYTWTDGGVLLFEQHKFNQYCGTSLIYRLELLKIPERFEDAGDDFVSSMLGSHRHLDQVFQEKGFPLDTLPFRGAIYRVGQSSSHSKAAGVWSGFFFNKEALLDIPQLLWRVKRLRWLGARIRRDFGF